MKDTFSGGRGGGNRSVMSAILSETGSFTAVSASSASGLESPQFVPRPPSLDVVCRKSTTVSTRTDRVSSQGAADTHVDDGRGCESGWSGGAGGVDVVQAGALAESVTLEGGAVVANVPSSRIEFVDGTKRRPSTQETVNKEKPDGVHCGDAAAASGMEGGNAEDHHEELVDRIFLLIPEPREQVKPLLRAKQEAFGREAPETMTTTEPP